MLNTQGCYSQLDLKIKSALVDVVVITCVAGANTTGASSCCCHSSIVVVVGVGDAGMTAAVNVTSEACRAGGISRWLPLLKTKECLVPSLTMLLLLMLMLITLIIITVSKARWVKLWRRNRVQRW
jgi:hypothetical protein